MLIYAVRRILQMLPVLFILTVVVFAFAHLLPGDPVDTIVGGEEAATPEERAAIMAEYGLDKPLVVQYGIWLGKVVQGDFGNSLITRRPVSTELFEALPATVYLALTGIILSMAIAIPLGAIAAVKRNTPVDYSAQFVSLLGISIPEFWFAIMAVLFFSLTLGLLPSSGYISPLEDFWGSLPYFVLPALTIGLRQAAYTMRLTRSSMLDEMSKDYVTTARAMGFTERKVIFKYTLRNALIPTVTISGLQLAHLLGGTIVLETIFAWPGIGQSLYLAIVGHDYPLIQAGILVLGVVVVMTNLFVDILYRVLNPRVALG